MGGRLSTVPFYFIRILWNTGVLALNQPFIASSTATVCPKKAFNNAVCFSNVYCGCIVYGALSDLVGVLQEIK